MRIYVFKVSLLRNRKVSRTIEVLDNISLYKLAEAIVGAYNFNFDHCFGFFSKITDGPYFDSEEKYELFTDLIEEGKPREPTGAGGVKKTKINEVWREISDEMLFLFDYGDNWYFVVELIDIEEGSTGKKYPRVFNKIGKAPKQY